MFTDVLLYVQSVSALVKYVCVTDLGTFKYLCFAKKVLQRYNKAVNFSQLFISKLDRVGFVAPSGSI